MVRDNRPMLGWINDAVQEPIPALRPRSFKDACGTFQVTRYTTRVEVTKGDFEEDNVRARDSRKCGGALQVSFTPDTFVRGDRVGLLQLQKCSRTAAGSRVSESFYSADVQPHAGVDGWYVDFGGDPCPFFGVSLDGDRGGLMKSDNGAIGAADSPWTPAVLSDRPSRDWKIGEATDHQFILMAVSFQAPPKNPRALSVYLCGLLTWGWNVGEDGRVGLRPLGTLENLPEVVEPVLNSWKVGDRTEGRLQTSRGMPLPPRIVVDLQEFGWKAR